MSFDNNSFNSPDNNISKQTYEIFQAIVNAIIPRSPGLAYEYGVNQYYGALDLQIEEYLIMTLNSIDQALAQLTADMLYQVDQNFVTLTPFNQLYILLLLRQNNVDLSELPLPFRNNPNLVISIINSFFSDTMMGYYSEWFGYGSTRLANPNQRVLEYYPISWKQVGYPGPSLGYRALRSYEFT